MKNVRKNQLKKCICVEAQEFTDIVHEILGEDVNVEYTLEGLDVYTDEKCIDMDDLCAKLTEYFDVKEVTSVHTDHHDYVGVWVVYRD